MVHRYWHAEEDKTGMQRRIQWYWHAEEDKTGMQRRIRNKEGRRRHLPPVTLSRGHPIDITEDSLPYNTTFYYIFFKLQIFSEYYSV